MVSVSVCVGMVSVSVCVGTVSVSVCVGTVSVCVGTVTCYLCQATESAARASIPPPPPSLLSLCSVRLFLLAAACLCITSRRLLAPYTLYHRQIHNVFVYALYKPIATESVILHVLCPMNDTD